jgi:4-hydroxybenzoate polyprenyltransferase
LKKQRLSAIYNLARPYQYIKNSFVFLPAFFSFKINDVRLLYEAAIVFIAFSLVASAVYIFNDWKDRELDRSHPEKCLRPIASGQITTVTAFGFLVVFLTGGLILAIISSMDVFFIIGFYFILNVLYSFQLKHIPIIDVTIISAGFVLRLFAGAEATQVALSHWIIVITFLLALFLSLAKRRDDILIFIKTDQKTRNVIDGYNLKFLDAAMVMTAAIVVLAYILWSISPEVSARLLSENIFFTSIFVVLGILRYMQITFVEEKSGNPTRILIKDRFIQLTLICWIGSFLYVLYFN